VRVEIVDSQLEKVGTDEIGHILVKSPGIVPGYLNNPEATAQSFRDGWFNPGDMASRSASGAIFLHGRADDMMMFDGIKIYPAEIERVLLGHPAVAEAAAYPIYSVRHQHLPVAAVILKTPATEDDLLAHCRSWLGSKAPVTIRILENLPRNAAGKVLKRELIVEAIQHIQSLQASKPGSEV
jgi:long-chain acyl-CoA synthetase